MTDALRRGGALAGLGMDVWGRERGWDEERIRTQNVEIKTGNRVVRVRGVQSRPELNGQPVTLTRWLGQRQRYEVQKQGEAKLLALKPECLEFGAAAEAIHRAVERHDLKAIEDLTEVSGGLSALRQEVETPHGWMPVLSWAAGTGRYLAVAHLAQAGADVHAVDSEAGSTALHFASAGGQPECVQALLDSGCNPNVRTTDSMRATPLMLAASQGRAEVVEILIACPGIDLEAYGPEEQATAFLLAAGTDGLPLRDISGGPDFVSDHARCLSLLAAAGCNTEATDSAGNTATTIAWRMRCVATQQQLSAINKERAEQRGAEAKAAMSLQKMTDEMATIKAQMAALKQQQEPVPTPGIYVHSRPIKLPLCLPLLMTPIFTGAGSGAW
jgi:hypothetical protein